MIRVASEPKAKARQAKKNEPSKKTPRPVGSPTQYTQEIASTICDRIIGGESLTAICKSADMPAKNTVLKWLNQNVEFATQYAHTRAQAVDAMFEELLAIADDPDIDPARARQMIDTRKWAMSKLAPKKYGDRLQVDASIDVQLRDMTDDALHQKMVELAKELGLAPVSIPVPVSE